MSTRVSFADLLKAGADKDKKRSNLKLASPSDSKPVAPEKDFTKVANSIVREAVPEGLFIGKSKQIYDYLYSITRGALQPTRSARVTKSNLMVNADIGSERTLRKNLTHLQSLGLVKITELSGQRHGNEYETFLPEELASESLQSHHPLQSLQSLQKVEGVLPPLSAVTAVTQTIENKHTYNSPKTFFKDFKEIDDEPAAQPASRELSREASRPSREDTRGTVEKVLNDLSQKITGRSLKDDDENLNELAELLAMEFEIAAARTDSISNVPAFLTEHLRRRLQKKPESQKPKKSLGNSKSGKFGQNKKNTDFTRLEIEHYNPESLDPQGRKTVLKTMQQFIEKGQREFVMSFQDTYTAEDWEWLIENLPVENSKK